MNYKEKMNIITLLKMEVVRLFFTNYETDLIRKVRNFKYVGSALYHLLMWKNLMIMLDNL